MKIIIYWVGIVGDMGENVDAKLKEGRKQFLKQLSYDAKERISSGEIELVVLPTLGNNRIEIHH